MNTDLLNVLLNILFLALLLWGFSKLVDRIFNNTKLRKQTEREILNSIEDEKLTSFEISKKLPDWNAGKLFAMLSFLTDKKYLIRLRVEGEKRVKIFWQLTAKGKRRKQQLIQP